MKRYFYEYETITTFSNPVTSHCFILRCKPAECQFQRVKEGRVYLEPQDFVSQGKDGFGNEVLYGGKHDAHDMLVFISRGIVEQQPYELEDACPATYYSVPSLQTFPDKALEAFWKSLRLGGLSNELDRAAAICHAVNQEMAYVSGSTNTATSAAEAFDRRAGVCQDFTHIMISLCRMAGMKARYVAGFIPGEGVTHAWVEVWANGRWKAFDPTHDRLIEFGYIKLAHGRDVGDCPVSRGIFTGSTLQQTTVRVVVNELVSTASVSDVNSDVNQ